MEILFRLRFLGCTHLHINHRHSLDGGKKRVGGREANFIYLPSHLVKPGFLFTFLFAAQFYLFGPSCIQWSVLFRDVIVIDLWNMWNICFHWCQFHLVCISTRVQHTILPFIIIIVMPCFSDFLLISLHFISVYLFHFVCFPSLIGAKGPRSPPRSAFLSFPISPYRRPGPRRFCSIQSFRAGPTAWRTELQWLSAKVCLMTSTKHQVKLSKHILTRAKTKKENTVFIPLVQDVMFKPVLYPKLAHLGPEYLGLYPYSKSLHHSCHVHVIYTSVTMGYFSCGFCGIFGLQPEAN